MKAFILCLLLLGPIGLYAGDASHTADSALDAKLVTELNIAQSDSVDSVKIFYVPADGILWEGPAGAETLERDYFDSATVRYFQHSKLRTRMLAALLGSSMKPVLQDPWQYHWACIFYDCNGKRLLSIALDGPCATVNGISATTDYKFLTFLNSEFSFLAKAWQK